MKNEAKRKADPKSAKLFFSFDLREEHEKFGELIHLLHRTKKNGQPAEELLSYPSLTITSKLAETDSKKIKIGTETTIDIHAGEERESAKTIGYISKNKDKVEMHIWVNWNLMHHIHLTLLSGKTKMITIFGTEVFNRRGEIYGIHILHEYETYGTQ